MVYSYVFLFSLFCYSLCCMRLWTACAAEIKSEFVVVHACLEETWLLLLPNAGLCALPETLHCWWQKRPLRRNLVAAQDVQASSREHFTVCAKRFRSAELLFGTTGTSSLLAVNASLARKSCLYQVPLVSSSVSSGSVHRAISLFFVIVVYVVGDSSHFQGTDHTCSTGTVISMVVCTVNALDSRRTSSSNTCC